MSCCLRVQPEVNMGGENMIGPRMDPWGTPHRDAALRGGKTFDRHNTICGRQTKPFKDSPGAT